MNTCSHILALENIHAAYLKKDILRGLSFVLDAGEIVTLLGENGSGKSTTLKVIAGLLNPSQGTVTYNNQDLCGVSIVGRQELGIGYLMQGGRVFPNLTVQENFNLATGCALVDTGKTHWLGDWFTDLRKHTDQRAGLLSGGQRQMLAIEMVLAQKPKLLLLDEPTAALSRGPASTILDVIRGFTETFSATVLLVEQNANEARAISHRVLQLDQGTLKREGKDR